MLKNLKNRVLFATTFFALVLSLLAFTLVGTAHATVVHPANCSTQSVGIWKTCDGPGAGNQHAFGPGSGNQHTDGPGSGNKVAFGPGSGNQHTDGPGAGDKVAFGPGSGNQHTDGPGAGDKVA